MQLSKLRIVSQAAEERTALIHKIERGAFGVTIDGENQDVELVMLVRDVLIERMRARVAAIEADLQALGVAIG